MWDLSLTAGEPGQAVPDWAQPVHIDLVLKKGKKRGKKEGKFSWHLRANLAKEKNP